jgi:hypothetical protein
MRIESAGQFSIGALNILRHNSSMVPALCYLCPVLCAPLAPAFLFMNGAGRV